MINLNKFTIVALFALVACISPLAVNAKGIIYGTGSACIEPESFSNLPVGSTFNVKLETRLATGGPADPVYTTMTKTSSNTFLLAPGKNTWPAGLGDNNYYVYSCSASANYTIEYAKQKNNMLINQGYLKTSGNIYHFATGAKVNIVRIIAL